MKRLIRTLTSVPLQLLLAVVALLWLTPIVELALQSMRPATDVSQSGWWTVLARPSQLTFSNYVRLIANSGIVHSFWNTVAISVPTTVLVLLLASAAAYAFAWISFPGRDGLFLLVVGLLVVPIQIGLIPIARLFGALGIYGSIAGVVLFHVAFGLPFAVFLLRNFFVGIPRELLDSARVDGAGHAVVYTRIIVPLAAPAMASLAILQFLWVWNDLLIAIVFASSSAAPLTAAILQQTRNFAENVDVIAPGAFIQMLVPLLVFFAFQRYFVNGLMGGAVKG